MMNVRLKRASDGYRYPPLELSIRRVELGGVFGSKQAWWEIVSANHIVVLAQSLDDVRQFIADIGGAAGEAGER